MVPEIHYSQYNAVGTAIIDVSGIESDTSDINDPEYDIFKKVFFDDMLREN